MSRQKVSYQLKSLYKLKLCFLLFSCCVLDSTLPTIQQKKERPFSNFEDLLVLEEKFGVRKTQDYRTDRAAASFVDFVGKSMRDDLVKELLSVHYYAILTDGSTDSSILKQMQMV